MRNEFELIESVNKLFKLEIHDKNCFDGLLVPNLDYVYSYNRSSLYVCGSVNNAPNELFNFIGCIRSIDDSGLTFHGPHETVDKASKRYYSFKYFIEAWHPFMPPKESVMGWCEENGCTPDFW